MATTNRAVAVLPARIRAGHTPLLKAYANLVGPSADTLYPLFNGEPQIIEHWLRRCTRLDATRQGDDHEKDLFSLLETLKDKMESQ